MEMPLVSVIMPVYNVENYLNKCIESVVNQTYKNLEIILVDDGSTDNSPLICDNWAKKDSRIRVLHKLNSGAGFSRNQGIENSTGEYIFFVDSDDYLDFETVEKCILKANETFADLIIFGKNEFSDDGNIKSVPLNSNKDIFVGREVIDELLPSLFTYKIGVGISVWGKMYKASVIKKNNIKFLSEREIFSEDAYFTTEIFGFLSLVAVINENFYYYRKSNTSYTKQFKKNHQALNDSFLEESLLLCKKNKYPVKISNSICTRYLMFTLAGMKQIINSEYTLSEKYTLIKDFFKNGLLLKILSKEVIKSQKILSRIFWRMLKLRLYPVCYILLFLKAC